MANLLSKFNLNGTVITVKDPDASAAKTTANAAKTTADAAKTTADAAKAAAVENSSAITSINTQTVVKSATYDSASETLTIVSGTIK